MSPPAFFGHVALTALAVGAARVAISWAVLQAFGAAALGVVVVILSLGQFSGALVGGSITDRFDRRMVLIVASVILGAGFASVAVALHFAVPSSLFVAALAFFAYFALAVHDNAARTLIPRLAEGGDIRELNGRFLSVSQILQFVAPAIAGWAIDRVGGSAVLLACFFVCLAAAGAAAIIRLSGEAPTSSAAVGAQAPVLATSFVLQTPWLVTGLAVATVANFFIVPIASFLVPIRVNEVGGSAATLGYFYSALSAGIAVGGFSRLPRLRLGPEMLQISAYIAAAACVYLGLAFFTNSVTLIVCGFAVGVLLCLFEVNWNSMIQERSPAQVLGRVYGISSWMSFGGRALGIAAAGWAVTQLPTPNVMGIAVFGVVATIAVTLLVASARNRMRASQLTRQQL